MKIMVERKSWNEILISCTLLVITYGILAMQVDIYHKNFNYKWTEKFIHEDSSFKIYSSYKVKRKSFFKNYYLKIYKGDQLFYTDECALSLENYCKSIIESGGLPIQNLKYKEGIGGSNQDVIYYIQSFEIINNGENKKIDYSLVDTSPKKGNNIFFIIIALLLCLAAHIWIIRKWLLTRKKDFAEVNQLEYWIVKIGLPLSMVAAFILFFNKFQPI
ncbi:hypothetical protein F959_01230 [Acinetobacter venetianus RAG-1 = CIP 110063]|uniref:Uncharacterized protein n=1 Tax=Acinetobacter venetianus (strain ATCC 31012 / DSM 23050 / BCRC 14357 / CCUG 45561 / CIP 110063 / KCTC 2702 / LMG 19082 / RAG-1) TaxID=1191460 RepID=N9A1Q7_ACIVR|nr:hypothetical protein [Acinetobacter venetianus]ENV37710.1 hypothetical protein F959_01230 [Acinetobacter venetianus RAG-1 = CIP 110063]